MGTRRTQVRALVPFLVRAVHWQPVPVAVVLSAVLLWWQHDAVTSPGPAVWVLRAVALLLAAAVPFGLDDRTRVTLAAVPAPLWWRVGLRVVAVVVPAGLAWTAALAWVAGRVEGSLPATALSLEAGALLVTVLATAAALARWRGVTDPGTVTAPLVVALALLLPALPESVTMMGLPGPGWDAAHQRWAVLLGLAAAVLAMSLVDPGRRGAWVASRSWASPSR